MCYLITLSISDPESPEQGSAKPSNTPHPTLHYHPSPHVNNDKSQQTKGLFRVTNYSTHLTERVTWSPPSQIRHRFQVQQPCYATAINDVTQDQSQSARAHMLVSELNADAWCLMDNLPGGLKVSLRPDARKPGKTGAQRVCTSLYRWIIHYEPRCPRAVSFKIVFTESR